MMKKYSYWTKKKEVLLIRWLLIAVVSYIIIFSQKRIEPLSGEFLLIYLFLISNGLLHLLKEEFFLNKYFDWALVIFDTSFVSVLIYFTRAALNEFYLIYFLIIIVSTLGENLKVIVGNALIICVIYSILLLHRQMENGIYHSELMLRIPFLFICSIFYGNLVSKFKRKITSIKQMERQMDDIMAVYEISNTISVSLDSQEILQKIIEKINMLLFPMHCQIILINRYGLEGKIITSSPKQKEKIISINKHPEIQEVFKSRKILLVSDIMQEPLLLKVRRRLKATEVKSIFLFPIIFQQEVLGILYIKGAEEEKPLSDHQIRLMEVIATSTANALKNAQLFEKIQLQASTDELTGLWNYRHFQQLLEIEAQRAKRKRNPISMLFIDIDNLKMVNDTYGHPQGDRVIIEIAQILKQKTRTMDVKARYAGDEFICLLPDAEHPQALRTAQRLCHEVKKKFKKTYKMISVSIGIATYPHMIDDPENLLLFSDQAMYLAKYDGGNQVRLASLDEIKDLESWNKKALDAFISVMSKRHFLTGTEMVGRISQKLKAALREKHLSLAMLDLVASLATAIDLKDHYTKGHSIEVREYSIILADKLNLSAEEKEKIGLAALLHDIGKIGVPENILTKPGKLNPEEEEKILQHPVLGVKILEPIEAFRDITPLIKYHHENWDGSGYPGKLKGEEIPIGAQIISIVDVFHSLISKRPYRKRLSFRQAVKIIREEAGKKWNKELTAIFLETIKEYKDEIMKRDID